MILPFSAVKLGIHIPVTPLLIFALTALLLAAWGIFTLILRYNWKHYSTRKAEMFAMSFFYFIGSAALIGLLCFSAFLYFTSSAPLEATGASLL